MKFSCAICHRFAAASLDSVLRHVGSVHSFEPGFHITCGVSGCARTYQNYRSFQKHVLRKHKHELDTPSANSDRLLSTNGDSIDDEIEELSTASEHYTPDLQRSAALFLLKVKEVGKISQVALNTVIEGVTELIQAHCDNDIKPFYGLETEYLQHKYFKEKLNLLVPEERKLGQSLRRRKVKGKSKLKLCWDYAYDIPLLSSLRSFLSNRQVLEEVLRGHKRSDNLLGDYCDGELYASHPLFSTNSTSLQILLFYDDLEVVNPLGSHTKKHKLAVFFYTLANLSPQLRSSLKMIHLVTVAKSVDVSAYGIDEILKPFMNDILKLEKDEGVDFFIEDITYNFRGTIALLPADNLASQYVGGFKGLHSAFRKCRQCMAISEDMKCKFSATDFQLRTRETHASHCMMLEGECSDHVAVTYGVVHDSILNSSKYFHVTEGLPPDCMHDMLEGTVQYEVKELLKYLVAQGIITLERINLRIDQFPYNDCDSANKPSTIQKLSSSDHSLKQSASQMWCLARLLPVIIGDCVAEMDQHWSYFY